MTSNDHCLTVRVYREPEHWGAVSINGVGSHAGESLPELFADVECSKHFCLGVPEDTPVSVAYVPEIPEIAEELYVYLQAFMSLPPHLRPEAVAWDHDNDCPVNPAHSGPFLNMDTFDWAGLAARFGRGRRSGQNGQNETNINSQTSRKPAHL